MHLFRGVNLNKKVGAHFSSLPLPFPFPSSPFPSPHCPSSSPPSLPFSPLPSLPLKSRPHIAASGSGGALKLPQRVRAEPGHQTLSGAIWLFNGPLVTEKTTINYGFYGILKGHSGAELHIYFLVHLESIYYQIFFYSKIVPNCAVAK